MKLAALLLIGMAGASSAGAQTSPGHVVFLPMPDTLPALLFAPDPLAGTMLRPLTLHAPDSHSFVEVPPEPAVISVAATADAPVVDPPAEAVQVETPHKPKKVHENATSQPVASTDVALAQDATAPAGTAPSAPDAAAVEPAPAVPAPVEVPPAVNPKESTVTVIVENVQTSSGTVNIAVCDKGLSKEGCPYHHEIPAQQGFVETEFHDLPPGNYAVVGYHDVNGNNQFDKLMGIPREPYALSGSAADKLVPTFADAELPIKAGDNAIIIRLKKLGG